MSTKKQLKVFVEDGDTLIQKMFNKRGYTIVKNHKVADIIVFSGGEDINPELYGQKRLAVTKSVNYKRDEYCETLYETHKDKPKIGICRGAQFLNTQCGGSMYQDVNNHGKTHLVYSANFEEEFGEVTSTHHQQMIPAFDAEIIAVAKESSRRVRDGATLIGGHFTDDIEVVYYLKEKCLCFQPHPEYGHENTEELFWAVIKHKMPDIYLEPESTNEPSEVA